MQIYIVIIYSIGIGRCMVVGLNAVQRLGNRVTIEAQVETYANANARIPFIFGDLIEYNSCCGNQGHVGALNRSDPKLTKNGFGLAPNQVLSVST